MTQKIARIFSLGICLLLLLGLFSRPEPVSAGESVWSAETIPSRLTNMLGRVGIDVRDFAISDDELVIYAVTGDSIAGNFTYKSTDGGVSWTELPVPITADLIAVGPDDNDLVVIANTNNAAAHVSADGGLTWQNLGAVQETPGGAAAAAIYEIDISPMKNNIQYIAAAGKEAAGLANVWYFNFGAVVQKWQETNTLPGIATDNETATLAFSPSFTADDTLVVVTDNASATGEARIQLFNVDTKLWNADAGYIGFPCVVVSGNITRLTSASLALSPTYQGNDEETRKLFIGITVDGDTTANATSGIYRFVDVTKTSLLLNKNIHSLAFNNAYLVAGLYDSTVVYRSSNPSSTYPTFKTSPPSKSPGGENKVVIAWLASSVIAGTSGIESAMAISTDRGATFNDISLIDTAITNARDVAVSSSGSKVYLVTDNGTNTSLWRKASGWKRVLSIPGATNFIVRIEPTNGNVIYVAKKGGSTIYYNSASGATTWLTRNCIINVQDMAVESTQNAYVLNAAGSVTKTLNGGISWKTTVPTTLANGATIVSVSAGVVFVGSQNGFVAYSTNGSSSWTKIPEAIGMGVGNTHVIADENFASNNIIYAACDTPGQNIVTWTIGGSEVWTDIFNGVITGGIYGLAITSDILYALEYNPFTNQSTLWRHIDPSTAEVSSTEWNTSTTTATTDIDDANVVMNATPRALKTSAQKLWAVKTNVTNKLYSYSDVILDVDIELMQPGEGSSVSINSITGVAYDVLFSWERPSIASEYELFIAYDEDFLIPVTRIIVATNNTIAFAMVGPQQAAPANVNFIPGETYYWKIRTTKPGYSQYSVSRFFSIESPPDAAAPEMVTGQSGMVTGTSPAFSWQPLQGATEYQFRLSDNPEMNNPLMDTTTKTTAVKVDITLEYGKTYYWQVRSIEPIEGNWSALVTFRVADKPAEPGPPVIAETNTPATIILPAPPVHTELLLPPSVEKPIEVTPFYFYIIIFTMSALLGVIIVLIVNPSPRRLFSLKRQEKSTRGPYRKPIKPDKKKP